MPSGTGVQIGSVEDACVLTAAAKVCTLQNWLDIQKIEQASEFSGDDLCI